MLSAYVFEKCFQKASAQHLLVILESFFGSNFIVLEAKKKIVLEKIQIVCKPRKLYNGYHDLAKS